MKKIVFFFLVFVLCVTHAFSALAASTATSSGNTNSIDGLDQQINNLKERIASRVAQLNLVEKRGIIGTISDVQATQLSVTDIQNNTRFIDVDELTKFSSLDGKTIGISDLTKGTTIGILGLYNKESQRILARFISVMTFPTLISGAITQIDKDNYEIRVSTADKNDFLVEVDSVTKTYVYAKDSGLTKSGFSKMQQAERIFVVGFPDTKNKGKIVASRIIRLPNVQVNPKIIILKPDEMGTTVSTGSGMKLAPLIKSQ